MMALLVTIIKSNAKEAHLKTQKRSIKKVKLYKRRQSKRMQLLKIHRISSTRFLNTLELDQCPKTSSSSRSKKRRRKGSKSKDRRGRKTSLSERCARLSLTYYMMMRLDIFLMQLITLTRKLLTLILKKGKMTIQCSTMREASMACRYHKTFMTLVIAISIQTHRYKLLR